MQLYIKAILWMRGKWNVGKVHEVNRSAPTLVGAKRRHFAKLMTEIVRNRTPMHIYCRVIYESKLDKYAF